MGNIHESEEMSKFNKEVFVDNLANIIAETGSFMKRDFNQLITRLSTLEKISEPKSADSIEASDRLKELEEFRHDMFQEVCASAFNHNLQKCSFDRMTTFFQELNISAVDISQDLTPDIVVFIKNAILIIDVKVSLKNPAAHIETFNKYYEGISSHIKHPIVHTMVIGFNPKRCRYWIMTDLKKESSLFNVINSEIKERLTNGSVINGLILAHQVADAVKIKYDNQPIFKDRYKKSYNDILITENTKLSISQIMKDTLDKANDTSVISILEGLKFDSAMQLIGNIIFNIDTKIFFHSECSSDVQEFWILLASHYSKFEKLKDFECFADFDRYVLTATGDLYQIAKNKFIGMTENKYNELVESESQSIFKTKYVEPKIENVTELFNEKYEQLQSDESIELVHSNHARSPLPCPLPTSYTSSSRRSQIGNVSRIEILNDLSIAITKNADTRLRQLPDHGSDILELLIPGTNVSNRSNLSPSYIELEFFKDLFYKWTEEIKLQVAGMKNKTNDLNAEQIDTVEGPSRLQRKEQQGKDVIYFKTDKIYVQGNQILMDKSIKKVYKLATENKEPVRRSCKQLYEQFQPYLGIDIANTESGKIIQNYGKPKKIDPLCADCYNDAINWEDSLIQVLTSTTKGTTKFSKVYKEILSCMGNDIPLMNKNWDQYKNVINNMEAFYIVENMATIFKNAASTSFSSSKDRIKLIHSASTDIVLVQFHTNSLLNGKNSFVYQVVKKYNYKIKDKTTIEYNAFYCDIPTISTYVCAEDFIYGISRPFRLDLVRVDRLAKCDLSMLMSYSILCNTGNKFSLNYKPESAKMAILHSFIGATSYTKGLNYIVSNCHHLASLSLAAVSPIRSFIMDKYVYGVEGLNDYIINKNIIAFIRHLQENRILSEENMSEVEENEFEETIDKGGIKEFRIQSPISGLIMHDAGDITNEINALVYMSSKSMHNRDNMMLKLVQVPAEFESLLPTSTNVLIDGNRDDPYTIDSLCVLVSMFKHSKNKLWGKTDKIRSFIQNQCKLNENLSTIETMTRDKSTMVVNKSTQIPIAQGLMSQKMVRPCKYNYKGMADQVFKAASCKNKSQTLPHNLFNKCLDNKGGLKRMLHPGLVDPYLTGRLSSYIGVKSYEVRDVLASELTINFNEGITVNEVTDNLISELSYGHSDRIMPVISMFDKQQRTGDDREIYMQQLTTKVMTYGIDQMANAASQHERAEMIHIPGREKILKIQKDVNNLMYKSNKKLSALGMHQNDYKKVSACLSMDQTKFSAKDNPVKFIFIMLSLPFLTLKEKLKLASLVSLYMKKQIIIPNKVMMMLLKYKDMFEGDDKVNTPIFKLTNGLTQNHFKVSMNWLQGNFNYLGSYCSVLAQFHVTDVLLSVLNKIQNSVLRLDFDNSNFFNVDYSHSDDSVRQVIIIIQKPTLKRLNTKYGSFCNLLLNLVRTVQLKYRFVMSISKTFADPYHLEFLSESIINGDLLPTSARYLNSFLSPTPFKSPCEDLASRVGALQTAVREGIAPEVYLPCLTIANFISYGTYHMLPGEKNDPDHSLSIVRKHHKDNKNKSNISGVTRKTLPVALGGWCVMKQAALAIIGYRASDTKWVLEEISSRLLSLGHIKRNEMINTLFDSTISPYIFIEKIEALTGPLTDVLYLALSSIHQSEEVSSDYFNPVEVPGSSGLSILSMPILTKTNYNIKLMNRIHLDDKITDGTLTKNMIKTAFSNPGQIVGRPKTCQTFCAKKLLELDSGGQQKSGVQGLPISYITMYLSNLRTFMPVNLEMSIARSVAKDTLKTFKADLLPYLDVVVREITHELNTLIYQVRYRVGNFKGLLSDVISQMDDSENVLYYKLKGSVQQIKLSRDRLRDRIIEESRGLPEINDTLNMIKLSYPDLEDNDILISKLTIGESLTYMYDRCFKLNAMNAKASSITYVRQMLLNDEKSRYSYQALYETILTPNISIGLRQLQKVDITSIETAFRCPVNDVTSAFVTNDISGLVESGHDSQTIIRDLSLMKEVAIKSGIYDSVLENQELLTELYSYYEATTKGPLLTHLLNTSSVEKENDNVSHFMLENINDDVVELMSFDNVMVMEEVDNRDEIINLNEFELSIEEDMLNYGMGLENEEYKDIFDELDEGMKMMAMDNMVTTEKTKETLPDENAVTPDILFKVWVSRSKQLSTFLANQISLYKGKKSYHVLRQTASNVVDSQLCAIVSSNSISGGYMQVNMNRNTLFPPRNTNIMSQAYPKTNLNLYLYGAICVIRALESIYKDPLSIMDYIEVLQNVMISGQDIYSAIATNISMIIADPASFIRFLSPLYHLKLISYEVICDIMKSEDVRQTWGRAHPSYNDQTGPFEVTYFTHNQIINVKGNNADIGLITHYASKDPKKYGFAELSAMVTNLYKDLKYQPSPKRPRLFKVYDVIQPNRKERKKKTLKVINAEIPASAIETEFLYYGNLEDYVWREGCISNMRPFNYAFTNVLGKGIKESILSVYVIDDDPLETLICREKLVGVYNKITENEILYNDEYNIDLKYIKILDSSQSKSFVSKPFIVNHKLGRNILGHPLSIILESILVKTINPKNSLFKVSSVEYIKNLGCNIDISESSCVVNNGVSNNSNEINVKIKYLERTLIEIALGYLKSSFAQKRYNCKLTDVKVISSTCLRCISFLSAFYLLIRNAKIALPSKVYEVIIGSLTCNLAEVISSYLTCVQLSCSWSIEEAIGYVNEVWILNQKEQMTVINNEEDLFSIKIGNDNEIFAMKLANYCWVVLSEFQDLTIIREYFSKNITPYEYTKFESPVATTVNPESL